MRRSRLSQILAGVLVNAIYEMKNYPVVLISTVISPLSLLLVITFVSGGAPHRNPDGKEILCPHLHVYREGYGDKWAIPVPCNFSNSMTAWQIMNEFMDYCKVITKPIIHEELFT